jgi:hypothetical protein
MKEIDNNPATNTDEHSAWIHVAQSLQPPQGSAMDYTSTSKTETDSFVVRKAVNQLLQKEEGSARKDTEPPPDVAPIQTKPKTTNTLIMPDRANIAASMLHVMDAGGIDLNDSAKDATSIMLSCYTRTLSTTEFDDAVEELKENSDIKITRDQNLDVTRIDFPDGLYAVKMPERSRVCQEIQNRFGRGWGVLR